MPEISLSQAEADALIAIEKHCAADTVYTYPALGGLISVPLNSPDKREQFILDIRRGRMDFQKLHSKTGLGR
jgi:hypothetical protein